jgi:predicted nucleic acid-binding protein
MSKYQISWYDSVIVAGANEAGCEVLYSEDLQDGQKFDQVRVVNPFA